MDLKNKTYYIQRTPLIKDYLKDITSYKVLTREQEAEIFKEYYKEDTTEDRKTELRNKVIMANQKFVFAIAKRFATDDTLIDLVSVGNLGLFAAFNDYDPSLGYRFTTMACNYVRREINQYLVKEGMTVRSASYLKYVSKVKAVEKEFTDKYGVKPTANEIADMIKSKYKININNLADVCGINTYSIDDLTNDEDEDVTDYSEYTQRSCTSNDYMDTMEKDDVDYRLDKALNILPEREQTIIKMSSGTFEYNRQYKDFEIAEQLGLSTERVRQLKHAAIAKMSNVFATV